MFDLGGWFASCFAHSFCSFPSVWCDPCAAISSDESEEWPHLGSIHRAPVLSAYGEGSGSRILLLGLPNVEEQSITRFDTLFLTSSIFLPIPPPRKRPSVQGEPSWGPGDTVSPGEGVTRRGPTRHACARDNSTSTFGAVERGGAVVSYPEQCHRRPSVTR